MKNSKVHDMNAPVWFDGTNINEAIFCDEFLSCHKIIFANGAFFTPDGRVTDDRPLRGEIYEELKCCAVNNIPRKITNILEVMKLAAHVEDFAPETDRIHLANGTLKLDGSLTADQLCKIHCHGAGKNGLGAKRQAELSGMDVRSSAGVL